MMSKHTPGEWHVERMDYPAGRDVSFEVKAGQRVIAGTHMREIGRLENDLIAEDEANARRIVACVNACAGISTGALEAGVLQELVLLAKRKGAIYDDWPVAQCAALAKAQGEQQ